MILVAELGIIQEIAYNFWTNGPIMLKIWSGYVWIQTESSKSWVYQVVPKKVIRITKMLGVKQPPRKNDKLSGFMLIK